MLGVHRPGVSSEWCLSGATFGKRNTFNESHSSRQSIQDDSKEAGVANRPSLSVLVDSGPASTGLMLI